MWDGRVISMVFVLLAARPADPLPEFGSCNCEATKLNGGWCPECKVGHLAGVPVRSRTLFEVLDAHGHEIDLKALRCESCRKASADHGFCDSCRIGFRAGKAYFSRLTYALSAARPVERSKLTCASCRLSFETVRWCSSCRSGLIGNLRIESADDFKLAKPEFERFLSALGILPECEGCAVGYFTRSMCPKCRKVFDGSKNADAAKE